MFRSEQYAADLWSPLFFVTEECRPSWLLQMHVAAFYVYILTELFEPFQAIENKYFNLGFPLPLSSVNLPVIIFRYS